MREPSRDSDTGRAYRRARIFGVRRFSLQYLLLALIVAGLVLVTWRLLRASADRPRPRVIGPDDDPEFLRRINPDKPA